MKKNAGVLFILLLFYSNVLGAEDVKKPSPAKDFKYDLNEEGTGVVIKKYLGKDVEVIIPEVIKTFPVVSIDSYAFSSSGLESITIPDSVKTIGEKAFRECANLKTVTLGKGVERIGNYAFSSSGLESITIPDSVKEIEIGAFYDCKNLKTVVLGKNVETIGSHAFHSSGLESITIPDSVKEIEDEAFYDCKNLKTVVLGKNVETIGSHAFHSSGLESITIPDSVKEIEDGAFYDCKNLKTVVLGKGVERIIYGGYVFHRCPNLSDESKAKIKATGYKGGF